MDSETHSTDEASSRQPPDRILPADAFDKLPELRRRSRLGQLARRPLLVAKLGTLLALALLVGAYAFLRATDRLPGQVLARRSDAAMRSLVQTPAFDDFVVAPLRSFLTSNLSVGAHPEALIRYIRQTTGCEDYSLHLAVRPSSDPSMLIGGWRDLVDRLDRRGLPVAALDTQRMECDHWLRAYVITRVLALDRLVREDVEKQIAAHSGSTSVAAVPGLPPISMADFAETQRADAARVARLRRAVFAGSDPALFAQDQSAVEIALQAVISRFGVSEREFDLILYLADCSQRMNTPGSGDTPR